MSNDNIHSTDAAPVVSSPHINDEGIANLLKNLPGLVGAIDTAIKDTAGKPYAFMLMIFTPEGAMHCCNADANQTQAAMVELVNTWQATGRGQEQEIVPQTLPAANEG